MSSRDDSVLRSDLSCPPRMTIPRSHLLYAPRSHFILRSDPL
jgi:hypothetical protein